VTPEYRVAALAAYVRGEPVAAICAEHSVSHATLLRWARAAGIPSRRGPSMGRPNTTTPEQDAAIAAAYARGEPRDAICAQYGVSETIIRRARAAAGVPARPPGRPRRGGP
jgi:transposase-like protein